MARILGFCVVNAVTGMLGFTGYVGDGRCVDGVVYCLNRGFSRIRRMARIRCSSQQRFLLYLSESWIVADFWIGY